MSGWDSLDGQPAADLPCRIWMLTILEILKRSGARGCDGLDDTQLLHGASAVVQDF